MKDTYTVAVSSATKLTCSQRIELEVLFARELERLLDGGEAVVDVYSAVTEADGHDDAVLKAERWAKAVEQATAVAHKTIVPGVAITFDVRLHAGATGLGAVA